MKTQHQIDKLFLFAVVMLALFLNPANLFAQKEEQQNSYQTLFGNSSSHGGYGGVLMGHTKIGDNSAVLSGFKGGWIIGHSLTLGLAGNAFVTEFNSEKLPNNDFNIIAGGYGGLLLEPIIYGMKPIHVSVPTIIGFGTVAFETGNFNQNDQYPHDFDTFFMVESGLELEMNITNYFRIAVGGTYRFTSNVELMYTDPDNEINSVHVLGKNDLNRQNFYMSFKFGKF